MNDFFVIDGQKIGYTSSGSERNRVVLFVHGNSLSRSTFTNQLRHLGLPCLAIDLPGHGSSDQPLDPAATYNINGYAKILVGAVNQLGLTDFILVGHSLGGHIAINALPHLEKVSGLLIFGTPPLGSVADLGSAFLPNPNFPYLLSGELSAEDARKLADSMLHRKENISLLSSSIRDTDPEARLQFGASVGRGEMQDEIAILKNSAIPVAILHGEHDSFVNLDYIKNIDLDKIYGGQVHVVKDSGHCPQLEQPEAFGKFLKKYYRTVFS